MKKPDRVDRLDRSEYLQPDPERGAEGERPAGLRAPQLGQVFALQLHHHVVEAIVPAAPDEPADVLLSWKFILKINFFKRK